MLILSKIFYTVQGSLIQGVAMWLVRKMASKQALLYFVIALF
jgi:hypothetical protein